MTTEAISIIVGNSQLKQYPDLLANVRWDGQHHSIRALVQPGDPDVIEIAEILAGAEDFPDAAHEFVNSFTTYKLEVGDYWRTPAESLAERELDCDDMAILLCSILRDRIPAENVFCGVGLWEVGGRSTGHMFVVLLGPDGDDLILEATAAPHRPAQGIYVLHGIFNDKYVFFTDAGLKEFDLQIPAGHVVPVEV